MTRADTSPVRPGVPTWVRVVLVVLGAPNAVAGLWAVAAPEHWFEHFPGWDPRLVAAEPPFNAHLAGDAGAGLLASGVVLLGAAWLADRRSVLLGIVASAAFTVPHAAYHTLNPAPGLSSSQDLQNAGTLLAAVAVTVVLAVAVLRHDERSVRGEGSERGIRGEHEERQGRQQQEQHEEGER